MGMYDQIECKYLLPVDGANAFLYQTKCTYAQSLDRYEIREDGTLWHEKHSGCTSRLNKRWVQQETFTGEIIFYDTPKKGSWLEFSAYFVNGKVSQINVLENTWKAIGDV
jgi:hypothetical protein